MDRKEMALMLHENHFNCAQSLVCAYANVLGADPIQAFKMAESFGFGMGSMSTCGCLTASAMLVGLKKSDGDLDNPKTRRQCYNTIKMITQEFEDKFGSTLCRDLKTGAGEGDGTKKRVPCEELIAYTVEMLDRYLLGIYDGDDEIKVIRNEHAKF